MGTGDVPEDMIREQQDVTPEPPKILDHLDHPSFLEIATYGDHDGGDTDSITVECTKAGCGEVVVTLWERGAENDESPRDQVERELHEAGVIEDPDMDGGLLG